MTVDPGDQRQKRSLIGAGLTIVRYAPVATIFRTAAKLRDKRDAVVILLKRGNPLAVRVVAFPIASSKTRAANGFANRRCTPGVHRVIARGLVVVRRHEDDRAPRTRRRKLALQLDPRNSAEVDVEQQA